MLKIIFFARIRELMQLDELTYQLSENEKITVQSLLKILAQDHPALNDYIEQGNRLMIAINQQTANPQQQLSAGDEVAFFPPVTGG